MNNSYLPQDILEAFEKGTQIQGKVIKRIRGGFCVEVFGVNAFLPGSQVEMRKRPEPDCSIIGKPLDFKVIKINEENNNVVVSHRILIEEEQREAFSRIKEEGKGKVLSGVVKNITDYGAFITIDGFDGLLHQKNISWKYISHPSDVLEIGQEIKVMVIDIDLVKERVQLGLKQLSPDPWTSNSWSLCPGDEFEGRITCAQRYGVFVEIFPDIEGLIYIQKIIEKFPSLLKLKKYYKKRKKHKNKIEGELEKHFKKGDKIKVVVLNLDREARKLILSPKPQE